jgi:23S rRNA (guanine2069-N7)-methyltransferase / 23S rRNA (guanine2445-N2)-methyltransferase
MPADFTLIATATFGLEAVVARELERLGYESRVVRPGWLAFRGDESAIARANLWLRASDRVLLELARFPAEDFGALFDGTAAVAWEELMPKSARVAVRGRSVKSKLSSVPACQKIVNKAIVERLKKGHRIEILAEDGPLFPVEVALLKDEARLVLDTSGAGLHKRGYRVESGGAPLKETLAAGLVLLSFYDRERAFLDPFCGAGTLAIEAALIGRNRAPGLGREFVAEAWPRIQDRVWARAREEARDLAQPPLAEPIEASDRDEAALALARRAAAKASVSEAIRFTRRDFREIASPRQHGSLVTNPPYGDRLGEADEVRSLYRAMPEVFRRFPTWSFFVLTARRDFETVLGQQANRRRKLFNGDIECTYFQFHGPRPSEGASSGRVFGGIDDKAVDQAEIFRNRLRKRAHHLRRWPKTRGTDCYRIYDRDIKEVPLVVERYGEGLLLVPSSDPLTSRTRAEHEDWLDLMSRTTDEALGAGAGNLFVYGRASEERSYFVQEAGLRFEVRLSGAGSFGIDPKDRELRKWVRNDARENHVLVTGPDAGSFAVVAVAGGARATTFAALDESSRRFAERSLTLNGIESASHRFLQMELESVLASEEGTIELVVLSLASLEGLPRIASLLAPRVIPGGILYLTTRAPRARLPAEVLSRWNVEDVTARSFPEDFRNRKLHRTWRATRREEI